MTTRRKVGDTDIWTTGGDQPTTPPSTPHAAATAMAPQAPEKKWHKPTVGPTCDLCHREPPNGGTSLCLSCGQTILRLMSIADWELHRKHDRSANAAQSNILRAYLTAMDAGGSPITEAPQRITVTVSGTVIRCCVICLLAEDKCVCNPFVTTQGK